MRRFGNWRAPNAYWVVVDRPFVFEHGSNKRPDRLGLPCNISKIWHSLFMLHQCQGLAYKLDKWKLTQCQFLTGCRAGKIMSMAEEERAF